MGRPSNTVNMCREGKNTVKVDFTGGERGMKELLTSGDKIQGLVRVD